MNVDWKAIWNRVQEFVLSAMTSDVTVPMWTISVALAITAATGNFWVSVVAMTVLMFWNRVTIILGFRG